MRHRTLLASLLLIGAFTLFLWISGADSRPFRVGDPDILPDAGETWGCATCHVNPGGGGPRNDFGQDYERIALPAGDMYTDELGRTDSDGDGATNDEEFNADPPTEPWNPDSTPPDPEPQAVSKKNKKYTTWAKIKKR